MMNKLLTTFLGLLIGVAAAGRTAEPPAENYLDYYHAIALAEEAAVNGSYQDAVARYQKTFDAYTYNNPIDCYVAAQVSAYASDTAACIRFLYKGISFGLPVATITGNPHLTACFRKTDPYITDSCLRLYQARIDHKARAAMLSLIRYDQDLIHRLPVGGIYEYTPGRVALKAPYQPIWDSLVSAVITLTRTSGFPAQKVIGTQNGDDSLFRTGPNAVFALYIFIHHCNAWSQVGDLLWTELLKGNITPQMYGVIYESSNGKAAYQDSVLYFASRPCQELKCAGLVRQQLAGINEARWKIGLGSYEVMQQKFKSRTLYYKWCRKQSGKSEPFFDFQCDLSFQAK